MKTNSLVPRPETGNMVVPVIQSVAQGLDNSFASMSDMRNAHDGGESPNMVEHLMKRKKNLTMANQISIK